MHRLVTHIKNRTAEIKQATAALRMSLSALPVWLRIVLTLILVAPTVQLLLFAFYIGISSQQLVVILKILELARWNTELTGLVREHILVGMVLRKFDMALLTWHLAVSIFGAFFIPLLWAKKPKLDKDLVRANSSLL